MVEKKGSTFSLRFGNGSRGRGSSSSRSSSSTSTAAAPVAAPSLPQPPPQSQVETSTARSSNTSMSCSDAPSRPPSSLSVSSSTLPSLARSPPPSTHTHTQEEISTRGKVSLSSPPGSERLRDVMNVHGRDGGLLAERDRREEQLLVGRGQEHLSSSCLEVLQQETHTQKQQPAGTSTSSTADADTHTSAEAIAATVESRLLASSSSSSSSPSSSQAHTPTHTHTPLAPLPTLPSLSTTTSTTLEDEMESDICGLCHTYQAHIHALQQEKKTLLTRLKAAQHGAGVLGEAAAHAHEEIERRTQLLDRMEGQLLECEEENEALRRQLGLIEQANEDMEKQQVAWQARCRSTEGMMSLLSEREGALLQENERLREELKHIRRRAQEYESLVSAARSKQTVASSSSSSRALTLLPSFSSSPMSVPTPTASSTNKDTHTHTTTTLKPPAKPGRVSLSTRKHTQAHTHTHAARSTFSSSSLAAPSLSSANTEAGLAAAAGGGGEGDTHTHTRTHTHTHGGGAGRRMMGVPMCMSAMSSSFAALLPPSTDSTGGGHAQEEGEEADIVAGMGSRGFVTDTDIDTDTHTHTPFVASSSSSLCLAPEEQQQQVEDEEGGEEEEEKEKVMLLYAHPDFETEFGGLVEKVFLDALSLSAHEATTKNSTHTHTHTHTHPSLPLTDYIRPADLSKAGPGTTVFYVAFVCTGRLDDPVHMRAIQPFLRVGAHVVLVLIRAGRGSQVERIKPLKDLAGLPCLEFLVFKRVLQTGTAEGYVEEVRGLMELLRKALPSLERGEGSGGEGEGGRNGLGGGDGGSGGSFNLPPLTDFLFDDLTHMVP